MTPLAPLAADVRASENGAPGRLVTVAELAETLGTTPGYVYAHADELGAIRLGSGPRARLRFDVADVLERLSTCSASRKSATPETAPRQASRRRARPTMGTSGELLPIRGRIRVPEAA